MKLKNRMPLKFCKHFMSFVRAKEPDVIEITEKLGWASILLKKVSKH